MLLASPTMQIWLMIVTNLRRKTKGLLSKLREMLLEEDVSISDYVVRDEGSGK